MKIQVAQNFEILVVKYKILKLIKSMTLQIVLLNFTELFWWFIIFGIYWESNWKLDEKHKNFLFVTWNSEINTNICLMYFFWHFFSYNEICRIIGIVERFF